MDDKAEGKNNRRELFFWAIFIIGIVGLAVLLWR